MKATLCDIAQTDLRCDFEAGSEVDTVLHVSVDFLLCEYSGSSSGSSRVIRHSVYNDEYRVSDIICESLSDDDHMGLSLV